MNKTEDIVGILKISILVIFSLFPFFLFCHFGGQITQQFEEIGDAVYQLEWYRLPLDMKNVLQVVIALAQKRIYMRGYGDTRTTHSVFKKVRVVKVKAKKNQWSKKQCYEFELICIFRF